MLWGPASGPSADWRQGSVSNCERLAGPKERALTMPHVSQAVRGFPPVACLPLAVVCAGWTTIGWLSVAGLGWAGWKQSVSYSNPCGENNRAHGTASKRERNAGQKLPSLLGEAHVAN